MTSYWSAFSGPQLLRDNHAEVLEGRKASMKVLQRFVRG
jgi:hypothetical protein